eukprot:jgi/Orpsp1_1/1181428/evm.model.c7180000077181.1
MNEISFISDTINKFRRSIGRVNILVAGKTDVGKSTLINAIFKEDIAIGISIDDNLKRITIDDSFVTIYNLEGFVLQNYKDIFENVKIFITENNKNKDSNAHIHLAWICIEEGSNHIEDSEMNLIDLLYSLQIPVIVIITKCMLNNAFIQEVKNICFKANDVIGVHAKEIILEDGHIIKPKNLDKLIESTNNYLPNNKKEPFISSQKLVVNIKRKTAEKAVDGFLNNMSQFSNINQLNEKKIQYIIYISGIF